MYHFSFFYQWKNIAETLDILAGKIGFGENLFE
jgi:hypothetical protein